MNRRRFIQTLLAVAAGTVPRLRAATQPGFSFAFLGDLHYDKLQHHELDWLERDKPDDLRQVREYSRLTLDTVPSLFAAVREAIALRRKSDNPVSFVVQAGDLVEGLCGSERLAELQNREVVEFVEKAGLQVPFLFTKGNHDITGQGAQEAFKTVFHPFLTAQSRRVSAAPNLDSARYTIEKKEGLFCFFDAYDKESLPWLEAVLGKRTQPHCFVVIHPPVVPYGARSTWHVFSGERDQSKRERLLDLLGKHNAIVLSGHIHKYNLAVRATGGGGKFLQLALSSVISTPAPQPRHHLSGQAAYTPDQVTVESAFSPATEKQRRDVYTREAEFVRDFEYADLPGWGMVEVTGSGVQVNVFAGTTTKIWRSLDLTRLMAS